MIEKLTAEQESKISEYRDRYFELAISTKRADREKAETAVRRLCDLGGVEVRSIEWVSNTGEGYERYRSPSDSLKVSLWYSLSDSLLVSLRDTLWDTFMDLPFDTGWVCYYTYCQDVLGVEYSEKSSRLDAYNELLSSCFGMWVVSDGTVILCERPTEVKVEDGKLVDIQWAA